MKRIMLVAVMALFMNLTISSQNAYFEKLQDIEGIEYINLDKSMMEAAFKASNPDADLSDGLDLEEVTIIMVDKEDEKKATKKTEKLLKKTLKDGFAAVVDVKEEDDKIKVYCKDIANDRNEYIVCYNSDEDLIILLVRGKLEASEAKNMIKVEFE